MLSFKNDRWKRFFLGSKKRFGISELLAQASVKMDLSERMSWMQRVLSWLKKDDGKTTFEVRLKHFTNILQQNPEWKNNFQESLRILLSECSFSNFFVFTGYTNEHGFWGEISFRIFSRFLPSRPSREFQEIILNVFHNEEDFDWLSGLSDENLLALRDLFSPSFTQEGVDKLRFILEESLLVLSAYVAHQGLTINLRYQEQKTGVADSSFFKFATDLQKLITNTPLFDGKESNQKSPLSPSLFESCRSDIDHVYEMIEKSGVSVATVHALEALRKAIDRIDTLLKIEKADSELHLLRSLSDYVAEVARAGESGRSIRSHIGRHFYLLSRKISERNGESGEHYIARNRSEFRDLFQSAMGGGVVVVFMTLMKTLLFHMGLAPLFLALGVWLIYSSGFLAMQAFGFTLATKIPSFTASRLAQWIKDARSKNDAPLFGRELRLVAWSQTVGLLGNVFAVLPFALFLHFLILSSFHHPLMAPEYASHTLEDLHPFRSPVLFLAALTGAELWASSICGGWFENFVAFHDIPGAIAHHPRLRRIFGDEKARQYAERFARHASGIATNLSLGFFFGFVPLLGTVLGFTLEGKHVTISTAGAVFAIDAIGIHGNHSEILMAVAGLIFVGVMNFVVSFSLALAVAARAQNVRKAWFWHFMRSIRKAK